MVKKKVNLRLKKPKKKVKGISLRKIHSKKEAKNSRFLSMKLNTEFIKKFSK